MPNCKKNRSPDCFAKFTEGTNVANKIFVSLNGCLATHSTVFCFEWRGLFVP